MLDKYYSPEWAVRKQYVDDQGVPLSRNAIIAQWDENGGCQSMRGTLMHWHIECYLNGYIVDKPHSPECCMFLVFKKDILDYMSWKPWRTEMSMFHCGLRLAGQADYICTDGYGRHIIIDWKRCKSIDFHGFNGEVQHPPLSHLQHCNFAAYSLQLNTYRHILESEYGLVISGMYLVVLHPDQWPQGPHLYKVDRMEEEMKLLVQLAHEKHGVSTDNFPGVDAIFTAAPFHGDVSLVQSASG